MEQQTYTVGQLIERLSQYDANLIVDVRGTDYYGAKGGKDISVRAVANQPCLIICGYDNWDDYFDDEPDDDETDI